MLFNCNREKSGPLPLKNLKIGWTEVKTAKGFAWSSTLNYNTALDQVGNRINHGGHRNAILEHEFWDEHNGLVLH